MRKMLFSSKYKFSVIYIKIMYFNKTMPLLSCMAFKSLKEKSFLLCSFVGRQFSKFLQKKMFLKIFVKIFKLFWVKFLKYSAENFKVLFEISFEEEFLKFKFFFHYVTLKFLKLPLLYGLRLY